MKFIKYDVIIAGGSFAGLSVASKIKSGKVLIIDQKEPGKGVKSACGTLLYSVKEMGLEKAVMQEHSKMTLHTTFNKLDYLLYISYCKRF